MRVQHRTNPASCGRGGIRPKRWGPHARTIVGVACVASAVLVPGCQKALLSPDEPRSQYDRYDHVRGQYEPQFVMDEYGQRKVNLRARLMPKE